MADKPKTQSPYVRATAFADLLITWDYTHAQMANKKLVILSAETTTTQYGEAYVAECMIGDEKAKVLIGGQVLVDQMTHMLEHLPVAATIVKVERYFTFQ